MKALIFKNPQNPMQSGKAKTKEWLLEPVLHGDSRFIDSLMGWTGCTDMTQELILSFTNQDDAVAYAKAQGIEYEIVVPHERKLKIRAYADNFRADKVN